MKEAGLHIRTASRLHFGLLGWGPQTTRQFGGLGLMIESPGIDLHVKPASSWQIAGALAPRIVQLVSHLEKTAHSVNIALRPARIEVDSAPPAHVGLGVGTQLSLAVARALLLFAGVPAQSVAELARLTGRGRRSGIGLHGFEHGGFIVDGGSRNEHDIPPLLTRLAFPDTWSVLVVRPPEESGLHGPDESRAFAKLPPISRAVTDSLCRLVLLQVLPAILEHDLTGFGAAIGEIQARVGDCFAPAQGGTYSSARASQIVHVLRDAGFVGVGQSSWGPTLYAFSALPEQELITPLERLRQRFGLDHESAFVTKASNRGASFVWHD
jgi:beta-ribofuranosylaminobenzene 5'-phosphate synthase